MRYLVIFCTLLFAQPSSALSACLVHNKPAKNNCFSITQQTIGYPGKDNGHQFRFGFRKPWQTKRNILDNKNGIISFVSGLVAVTLGVLMVTLIVEWSPFIALFGLAAAVLAVIFGAKGYRERPRGFAIAGLSIGLAVLGCAITIALVIGLVLLIL
jgi:hypothetical protein